MSGWKNDLKGGKWFLRVIDHVKIICLLENILNGLFSCLFIVCFLILKMISMCLLRTYWFLLLEGIVNKTQGVKVGYIIIEQGTLNHLSLDKLFSMCIKLNFHGKRKKLFRSFYKLSKSSHIISKYVLRSISFLSFLCFGD